jgi:ribosomal protein S18 acetylase RimI-like enzyme
LTQNDFSIRRAKASDIAAMRQVERRAAQLYLSQGYDYCATGPVRDTEEHERILLSGVTFVVEAGDSRLAGFAMFEPMDGEAHLVEIDVDPEFQRQGLARRLVDAGETWVRSMEFDAVTLTTYRDIPWNAPYYRRLGFVDFEPGADRTGLWETINREAAWGFAFAPRIAMRKALYDVDA